MSYIPITSVVNYQKRLMRRMLHAVDQRHNQSTVDIKRQEYNELVEMVD